MKTSWIQWLVECNLGSERFQQQINQRPCDLQVMAMRTKLQTVLKVEES